MEKSFKVSWYVIIASIFSGIILFSTDYWVLHHNGITFLVNHFSIVVNTRKPEPEISSETTEPDSCSGRYVYVHDLPSKFNDDMIKNCKSLNKWVDMCPQIVNSGFGPTVIGFSNYSGDESVINRFFTTSSWFSTNQFSLEIIFRERMKRYKCLTNDSSSASAVFVPFYAGLDVGRYLWGQDKMTRDSLGNELASWLTGRPEWRKMSGRDHFFVGGRIAWDFRRQDGSEWGNKLMYLPTFVNTTMLTIETSVWSNEFAIPYPTHFHPSTHNETIAWQNDVKTRKRPYLFSYVGGPRPNMARSIRGEITRQCTKSKKKCKLLECNSSRNGCNDPIRVMNVFRNSVFCLQPPGDSSTRRSIFDSILGGCIPVFFHPESAYSQYKWYFPKNYTKYSVFIREEEVKDGKIVIEKVLSRVGRDRVVAMRNEVVRLIPKIIYANAPATGSDNVEDAFDVAVDRVIDRVEKVRKEIEEGKDPSLRFAYWRKWVSELSDLDINS